MTKLLVSVRGKKEAIEALRGGAHIIDAEYPVSALGTQYPLNIVAIRSVVPPYILIATNIGEKQFRWATAAQAALGVALAGADIIKVGFGGVRKIDNVIYVMTQVVRNVHYWFPSKSLVLALFADFKIADSIDPFEGPKLAQTSGAQGFLIDTFDKRIKKNLFDYISLNDLKKLTQSCHKRGLQMWIAGSLKKEHLKKIRRVGIDVVCVRGAVCEGSRETGTVRSKLVHQLVKMLKRPTNRTSLNIAKIKNA